MNPRIHTNDNAIRPRLRYQTDVYLEEHHDQYNVVSAAKTILLERYPFWGIIASDMPLIETGKPSTITTMATDGFHIYYSPEFVDQLGVNSDGIPVSNMEKIRRAVFCIAHEIYHAMNAHPFRRGDRDSDIWGSAVDIVDNLYMYENKIGSFPEMKTTRLIPADPNYHDKSPETIYDELVEKIKKKVDEFKKREEQEKLRNSVSANGNV